MQYSQEKRKCYVTGFEVRADVIPWQACGSLKPWFHGHFSFLSYKTSLCSFCFLPPLAARSSSQAPQGCHYNCLRGHTVNPEKNPQQVIFNPGTLQCLGNTHAELKGQQRSRSEWLGRKTA